MEFVTPKVFHLAGTALDPVGVQGYLTEIGASEWTTDTESDGEKLIEIAGKSCYKSFHEDLNANLTRVRTNNNAKYLENILNVKHGSVIEHVCDTYAYVGVSRVFTHETVRHRLAGYSQESLRFVRLTELKAYFPDVFKTPFLDDNGITSTDEDELRDLFRGTFEYLEDIQLRLANMLDLDGLQSFAVKKKLTSAMRRLAPIGLATAIIMTTNARTWRHILQMRTHGSAEEEMRKVMVEVFYDLVKRYPSIYQDHQIEEVEGIEQISFLNEKV